MNEITPIPMRNRLCILKGVNESKDFRYLLCEAELMLHKGGRDRTVVCRGASTAAIVLADDDGVPRTCIFRENDELDWSVAEDLIRLGIDYRVLVEAGEEIPMVAGASYPRHREEMIFRQWGPTPEPPPEGTGGYVCWDYFDGDVYQGTDPDGIYPVFIRDCEANL